MGNVKDRYFKYAENGDQYVGRCLALLPILNVELAISPVYFNDQADTEWVSNMVIVQFHALKEVSEFGLMLKMCLASLLYHERWIADSLATNHVVRTVSSCFRKEEDLEKIKQEKWLSVSYPWSAPELVFSGIPPYCSLLQHIAEVRAEQKGNFFFLKFFFYNVFNTFF
jgi:hypothetical protein